MSVLTGCDSQETGRHADLSFQGIRVNTISPGYVKTEMTAPVSVLLAGELMES